MDEEPTLEIGADGIEWLRKVLPCKICDSIDLGEAAFKAAFTWLASYR